jgi:hypothetical protein
MNRSDQGSFAQIYVGLLGQSAGVRMVAGAIFMLAGSLLTMEFWEKGIISGLSIFFVIGGLFLFIPATFDWRKQRIRLRVQEEFLSHEGEIVSILVAAKRGGKNCFRLLNQLRILDPELRQRFLSQADEQLKREGFRR